MADRPAGRQRKPPLSAQLSQLRLRFFCPDHCDLQDPIHPISLFVLAWLFGGFSFTLYPLSMAYVCEKIPEDQIVAATGGFVLSYGIGAIAGPMLVPLPMEWLGAPGLFYFLALITLGLGCFGLTPIKSESPYKEQD